MFVYQYTYTGTARFDVSNRATATSGALNSGNVTTTGTDEVVFGGYGNSSSATTTNERIAGAVADHVIRSRASMWDKVFSTTFTGAATASGNSTPWLGHIIAFSATTVPDTTAPSIPTGLAAVAVSPTQINLSWNAATDNVGVVGYTVYRNGVVVGLPTTTTFQDTGLTRATTYNYTVSARDAAGNVSAPSDPQSATTSAFVIINVSAIFVSATGATITWTTDTAADSQVEYGATTSYGFQTTLNQTQVTSHSQAVTGLIPNTLYHYRVISRDSAGNVVSSPDFTFTTSGSGADGVFQDEILISGMNLPTSLEFLSNGDMLILELGGNIWRVPAGGFEVDPTPFLTLSNIGSVNGQQGLMDMVLDPAFATNHFYYVFYTRGSPNRDRVSRFTATSDNQSTVPNSEFVVYQDPQDADAEHHGGALNFGLDGKLYITTGEHFDGPDAQLLSSHRGKILRINSDGTIPGDNPFVDGAGPNKDEIWAYGLRNPFRAYIDPVTGKFYIADVGGNDFSTAREEVNLGVRGANYGWPNCEGVCSNPAFTNPIFSYSHNGRDAAITGGFIYHGNTFPQQYQGSYFYADYTQNWIRRLTFDANGSVTGSFNFQPPNGALDGPFGDIVSLSEGPDGALYYVDLGFSDTTGTFGVSKIRRIRFVPNNPPPNAIASALPTEGPRPLTVGFSSAGSSDPNGEPLSYLWNFGDNTTSAEADPVHTYTQAGVYTAVLTVSDGNTSTLANPIQINVGNKPMVNLLTPQNGIFFRGGDVINFSGDATDTEDGTLPASAYSWTINFLHAGHVHPALPTVGTKSGSFPIPTSGHDFSGDTRYEIVLTVTDSDGLQGSASVVIYPEKVDLSFNTLPGGLTINLDGLPHVTPFVYDTLVNFNHVIHAPNQTQGANSYNFSSWSDGGAATHSIVVGPAANQTYTATFTISAGVPLAFAQSKGAFNDASATTLTVQLTNVKAGSLIVAYVKWEGTSASTVTLRDGTTTFTADMLNSAANNNLHGRFYYLLSSTVSGTVTYTATWSAARPYRKLLVYEYSYGGTVSLDASNRATATSGNLNTGSITTTGTDEVVFASYGEYNANNTTNERINGLAADQVLRAGFASMWSKGFNSPFTGTATATGNSSTWIGNVIAFKRN
jgi:glucose/arabinose dehydrogenase/PKD repeat protein